MSKQLKDYLHLHLGCEVLYKSEIYFLCGISTPYRTNDKTLATFSVRPNKKGFRSISHSMENFDEIKLILRPLPDMRNDDIKGWDENVTITPTPYCIEIDSNDEFGEFTSIYPDGSILSRSKDDGEIRPINGGELFRLLLSKHFDLFGLIESGLAIDKTKTNTTE